MAVAEGLLGRVHSRAAVGRGVGNSIRHRGSRSNYRGSTFSRTVSISAALGFHSFAAACLDPCGESHRAHPLRGNVAIRICLRRFGARLGESTVNKSLAKFPLTETAT